MTKLSNISPSPEQLFENKVHKIGRTTLMACILLALSVPLMLWWVLGVMPPMGPLLEGIFIVSSFMILISAFEILAFYPILGISGLYISYTTGNISNLKLPCAAIGMEAADVKPATREGDIISTIAMSGSVIVCELILVLGVLLLVPMQKQLADPMLKPAFDQILPALFGALGAYFILKHFKLAIIPIIMGLLTAFFHVPTALSVPICVLMTVLGSRALYKKGFIKG